ncbi:MAG: glycoside hydrolase family 3 C-terminal domain-containing protein [Streptosporangiaceae bacterium]|jgi:beta-glucosidase
MSQLDNPDVVPGRASGRAGAPEDLITTLSLDDKIRLLTGTDNWHTAALPEIGLRAMAFSDGPAGVRGVTLDERNPSASLPCPSALGATWNPELITEVARALGTEARSKGIDVLLAPTINIMRTPLGGRGFESFGEDPVLVANAAVAFVTGLQAAGVAAAVKHFVGNDSETQRWTYDALIDEDVLHEIYLLPFEAAITLGHAGLVMTGYNSVNGASMTEQFHLLTTVLKRQWGFDGVALSDWHAARSTVPTAKAGLDLAMPGPAGPWGPKLAAAVRDGQVSEAEVADKALRVLRLASRVGALGVPDGEPRRPELASPALASPALLREAAAAAFCLLKNDGALPLATAGTLAVIGPNAVDPVTQGGGSATVPPVSVSTPAEALIDRFPGGRVTVAPGCVTWTIVPQPPPASLTDPETHQPGTRIEFRSPTGELLAAEHRTATMFTWWDGLPDGIGWGGQGTITLRTRYRPRISGPHVIGAGGVGHLTLAVDETIVASGDTPVPADPVEVMVRPGEIRAVVELRAGHEAEIGIELLPENWAQGPVAIRLGVVPEPDADEMLADAVAAARDADVAVVVVGSGPATESEGFDRPGLALPGRQDELVRRVAEVNDRTVVVVNAGMPVLLPWADEVAAVGYAWLAGQEMGDALADVLTGQAEPGGRLPVTIPRAEADCPVLHAMPAAGQLRYAERLLVGYRGYDRAGIEPHFAFGHGLGYTTWEYESATVTSADGDVEVDVVVRNTGPRAGREVVQAYLELPAVTPGRPLRTLAAFTAVTASSAITAVAHLVVPRRSFARYDPQAGDWVWPDGPCTLRIGRSSRDLRLSVQCFTGGAATSSTS